MQKAITTAQQNNTILSIYQEISSLRQMGKFETKTKVKLGRAPIEQNEQLQVEISSLITLKGSGSINQESSFNSSS